MSKILIKSSEIYGKPIFNTTDFDFFHVAQKTMVLRLQILIHNIIILVKMSVIFK